MGAASGDGAKCATVGPRWQAQHTRADGEGGWAGRATWHRRARRPRARTLRERGGVGGSGRAPPMRAATISMGATSSKSTGPSASSRGAKSSAFSCAWMRAGARQETGNARGQVRARARSPPSAHALPAHWAHNQSEITTQNFRLTVIPRRVPLMETLRAKVRDELPTRLPCLSATIPQCGCSLALAPPLPSDCPVWLHTAVYCPLDCTGCARCTRAASLIPGADPRAAYLGRQARARPWRRVCTPPPWIPPDRPK